MHHSTPKLPPRQVLIDLIRLAAKLQQQGRWGEAQDRIQVALREHQTRQRDRTIGQNLNAGLFASDLAKILGIAPRYMRTLVEEAGDETAAEAALAELRDMTEGSTPRAPAVRVSIGGRKRA